MTRHVAWVAVVGLLLAAAESRAESYVVFQDDRAAFESALLYDPFSTVVDSGGAFAPDPSAATGQPSVLRTGTIDGRAFAYLAYDVDFSNAPTGALVPGAVGGGIAGLSAVGGERPAAQGGAVGAGTWGLDSGSGSSTTRNALLVNFTTTPGGAGVGHFGIDLVDFEASSLFTRGQLRLYVAGALVFSYDFAFDPGDGSDETHFLGVAALGEQGLFDQAVVVLGDDTAGGGKAERWAADRITLGRAVVNPEPATLGLFGLGAAAIAGLLVHRRQRLGGPRA